MEHDLFLSHSVGNGIMITIDELIFFRGVQTTKQIIYSDNILYTYTIFSIVIHLPYNTSSNDNTYIVMVVAIVTVLTRSHKDIVTQL